MENFVVILERLWDSAETDNANGGKMALGQVIQGFRFSKAL